MDAEIRTMQVPNRDNDACQYAAATALDEILALFADDGYSRDEIMDLIDTRLGDLFEDVPA